jgi:uncharacterized BrkB/YihY/UPF0761 family membrane protein
MTTQTKDRSFWVFLFLTLSVIVPIGCIIGLAIPGITFYKMKHGADARVCYSIFAGYIFIWAAFVALHLRFRQRDKLWASLFGVCFYALLFLSWRL